jgi:hypothetical protein
MFVPLENGGFHDTFTHLWHYQVNSGHIETLFGFFTRLQSSGTYAPKVMKSSDLFKRSEL